MTLADSAGGGWHAAMRVLAALVERSRTGNGKFLDVSAAEGVLQLMSMTIDGELATGQPAAGQLTFGKFACYGVYGTADGKSLSVGAIEVKFFANLCVVLGLDDLAGRQYQPEAQDDLRRAIAAVFRTRTPGTNGSRNSPESRRACRRCSRSKNWHASHNGRHAACSSNTTIRRPAVLARSHHWAVALSAARRRPHPPAPVVRCCAASALAIRKLMRLSPAVSCADARDAPGTALC